MAGGCYSVIKQDLNGGINILVQKGWFSLDDYNYELNRLGYPSYESYDRPQAVPEKSKKLSGKAVSLWVHIRNFPMIMKSLIRDQDDEVFQYLLLLVDITARILAMEFRGYEIDVLEEKVIEFLDARIIIFSSFPDLLGTPKPKHHMITHYGQAIRLYGPPLSFWTARFESKHRIAKNVSESAKNFKNISWTVASRQQMRMASVYYQGMFDTKPFAVAEKASYKKDLKQKGSFWDMIRNMMDDEDLVCGEILIQGVKYQNGDLVVHEVDESGDVLKVGVIKSILVKKNEVFLVNHQYEAVKNNLGIFESRNRDSEYALKAHSMLADIKPLIMRGTAVKFQFVLHHYISFDYK